MVNFCSWSNLAVWTTAGDQSELVAGSAGVDQHMTIMGISLPRAQSY
jgi:hypothetical protein